MAEDHTNEKELSTGKAEEHAESSGQPVALWNPGAAAGWSFIFTPVLGSYLHLLNWRALGEHEKEKKSKSWFYRSIAMLMLYILAQYAIMSSGKGEGNAGGLCIIYFIVWYFVNGRLQGKYVKEKFGKNYPRRPWAVPLLAGMGAVFCYWVLAATALELLLMIG